MGKKEGEGGLWGGCGMWVCGCADVCGDWVWCVRESEREKNERGLRREGGREGVFVCEGVPPAMLSWSSCPIAAALDCPHQRQPFSEGPSQASPCEVHG